MFKNAVIYYLNSNRQKVKVPKLKEILEKAIAKAEQDQRAKRSRALGHSNLEFLSEDTEVISDERFQSLQESLTKILDEIEENDQNTKLLQGKLNWTLRKPEKTTMIKREKKGKSNIIQVDDDRNWGY